MSSTHSPSDWELTPVNSHVLLSQVVTYSNSDDSVGDKVNGPSVILIFGWMDAKLPHLNKYVHSLRRLYSRATIILIRSYGSDWYMWMPQHKREALLEPAADILLTLRGDPQFRGVLIHSFSNGKWCIPDVLVPHSAGPYDKIHNTYPFDYATALVLDSAPGESSLSLTLAAFTSPLHPLVKLLAIPVLPGLYLLLFLVTALSCKPPVFIALRKYLNTVDLLPGITTFSEKASIPRLYVYSKADKMVSYKSVERHIADAKAQGFNVRSELYEASGHVVHVRDNPERYWMAVQRLWELSSMRS